MLDHHLKLPVIIILVITSFLLVRPNAYAQTINSKKRSALARNWEVSFNPGFSQFYGDVSNHNYLKKFKGENNLSPELTIRKMLRRNWGIGMSFYYTGLKSIKDIKADGTKVNYSLSGKYYDASLFLYVNISNLLFKYRPSRKLTVYGTMGFGYGMWNSLLTDNISGLLTRSGSPNGASTFATKSFVIPVGLGLNYSLSEHWSVQLGGDLHTVLNDDVDVWPDGFPYDQLFDTKFGLTYYFKSGRTSRNRKKLNPEKKEENCDNEELFLQKKPIPIFDYTYHEPTESKAKTPSPDVLQITKANETAADKAKTYHGFRDFEFRVQILATRKRLANPGSLQGKYKLTYPVLENYQDGLYRYSTGSFDQYQAALALNREIKNHGVFDAFVVAYSHGKRIPLTAEMKTMTGHSQSKDNNEPKSNVIY